MPVDLSLKINGLKELRSSFAKAPRVVGPQLQKATIQAGKVLVKRAKGEAPIKTGTLRRSISMDYKPIEVSIYPSVKYAWWVHQGFDARDIYPRRKRALRFKLRDGSIIYSKRVRHPGFKGNPFMERTIDKEEGNIQNIFSNALNIIVQKL